VPNGGWNNYLQVQKNQYLDTLQYAAGVGSDEKKLVEMLGWLDT
jgi:hypothetical protein